MHIPGILGMPRRIYTYAADRGWGALNLVCTIGAVFQALGLLVFVFNIIRSLRKGQPAGNDPWDAWTLEWATSSPPPEYNFAEIPVVRSRRPLWDLKHPTDPDWKYE
jgi:cytochrome c oxidase subunit 1